MDLSRVRFGKLCRTVLIALVFMACSTQTSRAYDNDTHFWFAYYLAVKAGYTPIQAAQIASADVGVDFDEDTQPVTPSIENFTSFRHPLNHFQYVRHRLHALPTKSEIIRLAKLESGFWWDPIIITDPKIMAVANELVLERKVEFWRDTLRDGRNPGVFLHFIQDTFAHNGFASYIGHAGYYRIDFMSSDRAKAERMAFTALKYLIAFREVVLAKKPAAQFSDPEGLNLSNYLSAKDQADIKLAVQRFSDVNPSKGTEANALVMEWKKLPVDEQRERNNRPPTAFIKPFYDVAKENPVPDSSRGRDAVAALLGIKPETLPSIWAYDLKDTGYPENETADEAYVYKQRPPSNAAANLTADDEKNNKEKKKIYDASNRRQCLAFKLVDAQQTIVPVCAK
jgi:hypothetical protein